MVKNNRADLVPDDVLVMAHLMKEVFGTSDALTISEYRQDDEEGFSFSSAASGLTQKTFAKIQRRSCCPARQWRT